MTNTIKESFISYADNMLQNIADELNLRRIDLVPDNGEEPVMYNYDTIHGTSLGFNDHPDLLFILGKFFTGGVVEDMEMVRTVVNVGLAQRNTAGIKVRQPLSSISIPVRMEA